MKKHLRDTQEMNNTNLSVSTITNLSQEDLDDLTFRSCLRYGIGSYLCASNALVLIVLLGSKKIRGQKSNIIITGQALFDFLCGFFMIMSTLPFQLTDIALVDEIHCKFIKSRYFLWSAFVCSTYNILFLTVERYIMVLHPIFHLNRLRKWVIVTIIILIALSSAANVLILPLTSRVEHGFCLVFQFESKVNLWTVLMQITVLLLVIPTFTIVFTYARIYYKLRRMNATILPETSAAQGISKMQLNILKTSGLITSVFVLCNLPSLIQLLIKYMQLDTSMVPQQVKDIIAMANFYNSGLNPVIYVLKFDQFKAEVVRIYFKLFGKN